MWTSHVRRSSRTPNKYDSSSPRLPEISRKRDAASGLAVAGASMIKYGPLAMASTSTGTFATTSGRRACAEDRWTGSSIISGKSTLVLRSGVLAYERKCVAGTSVDARRSEQESATPETVPSELEFVAHGCRRVRVPIAVSRTMSSSGISLRRAKPAPLRQPLARHFPSHAAAKLAPANHPSRHVPGNWARSGTSESIRVMSICFVPLTRQAYKVDLPVTAAKP